MKGFAAAALCVAVLLGGCAVPVQADAQTYYSYGYTSEPQYGPSPWVQERWARREARQQYWAQRREVEQRQAYEAGRRQAYRESRWGHRGNW